MLKLFWFYNNLFFVFAVKIKMLYFLAANDPKDNLHKLTNTLRVSYGLGVAFKLGGVARLELNYCVPYIVQKGDR